MGILDELTELVAAAVRDVLERDAKPLPATVNGDTTLFGAGGLLDSLGLVSLLVAVEEGIHDRMGHAITLADDRAMSQVRSPFRTVRSLAEYAAARLEERAP